MQLVVFQNVVFCVFFCWNTVRDAGTIVGQGGPTGAKGHQLP